MTLRVSVERKIYHLNLQERIQKNYKRSQFQFKSLRQELNDVTQQESVMVLQENNSILCHQLAQLRLARNMFISRGMRRSSYIMQIDCEYCIFIYIRKT